MITQKELNEIIHYDKNTGVFTWVKKTSPYSKINIGDAINTKDKYGYVLVRINHKRYRVHRLAFIYMNGEIKEDVEVDHINGKKNDNRWENLRLTDTRGNGQNRPEHRSGSLQGVTFRPRCKMNPWYSQIQIKGKKVSLGFYKTKNEAHLAYVNKCEEIKSTSIR